MEKRKYGQEEYGERRNRMDMRGWGLQLCEGNKEVEKSQKRKREGLICNRVEESFLEIYKMEQENGGCVKHTVRAVRK